MSQAAFHTSNPVFENIRKGNVPLDYGNSRATISGILNKTTGSLLGLIAVALVSYLMVPDAILMPLGLASAVGTMVVALVVAVRRRIGIGSFLAYIPLEGLFLGAISKSFDYRWPGIASQALVATFVTAVIVFLVYRSRAIRMSAGFIRFVGIATMAMAGLYLINLVLVLCHVNLGIVGSGSGAGPLSWAISALAIFLATANLLIDFNAAEQVVASGASEQEEWRVAFGLITTLAWMYVEILRILSYFRN